jgi:alpha-beta hydrolase superfamily lysophospholipase
MMRQWTENMFTQCNNEIRVLLSSGNMFIVTNTVHKYMKYVNNAVLISPFIAQPPRPSSVRKLYRMFPMNTAEVTGVWRGKL